MSSRDDVIFFRCVKGTRDVCFQTLLLGKFRKKSPQCLVSGTDEKRPGTGSTCAISHMTTTPTGTGSCPEVYDSELFACVRVGLRD